MCGPVIAGARPAGKQTLSQTNCTFEQAARKITAALRLSSSTERHLLELLEGGEDGSKSDLAVSA